MGAIYQGLEPVEIAEWDAPLPLGPSELLHGRLENGMTYYVRPCKKPAQRAAIALVVRVGSAQEEEHERGVAHILEHLAFNATENYSNHQIVSFLEAIGAAFGPCQNAYTSADETVYQLTVPTEEWRLLDQAIGVLAEWAGRIRCAPSDLEKERGPVLEEWRMGRTSGGRMQEAHWQLMLEGSKYADRLPIGLESIIKGVPAATVRSFYEKWYHPGRMAVVVVGDFGDPEKVVNCIRSHMSALGPRPGLPGPNPQPSQQQENKKSGEKGKEGEEQWTAAGEVAKTAGEGPCRGDGGCASCQTPAVPWAPHFEPRCRAFVDREAQGALVYASFKVPRRPCGSPSEYVKILRDGLFVMALNNRLYRLSHELDPPFYDASASDESLCGAVDTYILSAAAPEGGTLRALESLLTEVARIRLRGLSEGELQRAVRAMQAEVETTYLERHQSYSTDIRDEYTRHFLLGEFVTGQEYEARLIRTLLPGITRADVEGVAKAFSPRASAVFKTVEHRRRHGDADIAAVVARVAAAEDLGQIGPWEQDDVPDSILPFEPSPGGVATERALQQLGGHEMILNNGMRVVLLPKTFLEDELLVTGLAVGGLSELSPSSLPIGRLSPLLAGELGVYGHKPEVLNDILAGKRVELSVSASAYSRGFRGSASPVDAAEVMQLIHALFTCSIEVIESDLATALSQLVQSLEAQRRSPQHKYDSRLRAINYGGCYYFEPLTVADVERVDPHAAVAVHLGMFANPAEYTIVLTGNLSRERALPLIEMYLASIPPRRLPPTAHAAAAATMRGMLGAPLPAPAAADDGSKNSESGSGEEESGEEEEENGDSGSGDKNAAAAAAAAAAAGGTHSGKAAAAANGKTAAAREKAVSAEGEEAVSLPVSPCGKDARRVTPLPYDFPEEPVTEDVEVDMVSPLCQVQITFPCLLEREKAIKDSIWIDIACRTLETRLLQALRFKSGKVYSVAASPFFGAEAPSREGVLRGEVAIAFGCSPEDRGPLVAKALAVATELQAEGPTAEEAETVRTLERLEWESAREENTYWHEHAVAALQGRTFAATGDVDGVFARMVAAHEQVMSDLSPETLKDALQRLLPNPPTARHTVITMIPQPPTLLQSAALRLYSAWGAAVEAAGSERRAAAAAAAVGVAVTAAAAALVLLARRRRGGG